MYFAITKESPAHEICVKAFEVQKVWHRAIKDIDELLGESSVDLGLKLNCNRLHVRVVPEHLKSQFCKDGRARVNSEINKKFLEIAKGYGLYCTTTQDIALCLGTAWYGGKETYHKRLGKYYICTENKIENMTGLIEISALEFARLTVAQLEAEKAGVDNGK